MRYYLVHVAELSYQKSEPLTYCYDEELVPGTLVLVPYGKKQVAGFAVAETSKPAFTTKKITSALSYPPLPKTILDLHAWMTTYYPGSGGATTQLFVPSGLSVKPRKESVPKKIVKTELPPLTSEQISVIKAIENSNKSAFLIHGETGSGKTRLYLEEARLCLSNKRSVLILVPEISLITQFETAAKNSLDAPVITLHSGLTKATRMRNWLRLLNGAENIVVIGTRSALFAPLKNLGLVVVDEMHEPAYKQESAPRYYGLRAAAQLARLSGSKILYGSATPPLVEYFVAKETNTPILRMVATAKPSEKVKSSIIDLKDTKLFARHRSFSDPLLDAIGNRLISGEQSLLFLNRRGTARQILCQACGWQAACPRCDIPLTYHGDDHTMRCHTCAFRGAPPYVCPSCSSNNIIYRSLGTKALVDALQNIFPEATIKRFDTDNLAAEQLDKHFEAVHAGKVDILVGTQMLGKGLDLPKLSLVGIVNADTSLGVPDFSSTERSYQLLHQAIGRVGRGHTEGEVIVQTFNPENTLLKAAIEQNWHKLYDQEIVERQQFGFPPFYFLMKVSVSRKSSDSAEKFISKLYVQAREGRLRLQINEPTPSFYEKTHSQYNWQMVIKAKQRSQLIELVKIMPKGDWTYDLDPINLL